MNLTKSGYRINKNGKTIKAVESDAFCSKEYLGKCIKKIGVYYFFNRKQGDVFIYLP